MLNLPIIQAVYCPLSDQLHDINLCEQLCDNYYIDCLQDKLIHQTVFCPIINQLMDIGSCADNCDHYEGDGKDVEYMMCSKLGMTISQVYQMNLEYQQFVVFRNTVVIGTMIVFFILWMTGVYLMVRKDVWFFEDTIVIMGMVGVVATVIVAILAYAICDGILLPMQYPEYTAMLQTMIQIIPGCGC